MKITKFTLILLMLISPFAMADAKPEKWYRVEVLVFETKDKAAQSEEMPLDPGKPNLSKTVNINPEMNAEFGQLPEDKLTLIDAKRKIQKSYHLVTHQGWRQKLTDKEHAQKIHLVGGKIFGATEDNAENGTHEVDGTIKVSLSHYLHVDADLLLHKPMSGEESTRLQTIRLKDTNRVKLNEIHYFDHPMYGVIVVVTPEKATS